MNLRPYVILAMFLSLATSFAVFISGCSWGTGDTSATTTAISPIATGTPLSTVLPSSAVQLTQTPTNIPPSTATPLPVATPSSPSSSLSTKTPIPTHAPSYTPMPRDSSTHGSGVVSPCEGLLPYEFWRWHHFIQWSPDGSRIVFDAETRLVSQGADTKLYVVESDGSRLRKLLNLSHQIVYGTGDVWYLRHRASFHLGSLTYFDISPDGSKIAYSTCRYQTQHQTRYATGFAARDEALKHDYEIAVSDIEGLNSHRLTDGNNRVDNYPVWSPDGTRIAFIASRNASRNLPTRLYTKLFSMAADGSDIRHIANRIIAPRPPVWSPDGTRIAFVVEEGKEGHMDSNPWGRAIYVVGSDGSNLTRISDTLSPPSWSPDGTRLAFAGSYGEGGGVAVFNIRADGSDISVVTEISEDLMTRREVRRRDYLPWVHRVLWSPTDSRIVFTCATTVCVVNLDGSRFVQSTVNIPGGSIPEWSPDGSRIAVRNTFLPSIPSIPSAPYGFNRFNETIRLYTMAPDGTDVRVLVQGNWSMVAENSGWRDMDASIDACDDGYVVPNPERNQGLVADCATLVSIRHTLAGVWRDVYYDPATGNEVPLSPILNWYGGTPIDQWDGVTIGGVPPRVIALELPAKVPMDYYLFGTLPPELERLTKLQTLNLSRNHLSGGIPPEIGNLEDLNYLSLVASRLSGCIPKTLEGKIIEQPDTLGFEFCK